MQQNPRWRLPLSTWCEWFPTATEAAPPVPDCIEPLQRRRLSPIARAALWAAHRCAHDVTDVRMIYASRHGEVARTTEMLEQLAENEPLSPTAFSMSVLNATLGLYSIARGLTAPATAVSSGEESLGYALLEAHGQLQRNPDQQVLVVYADETVPAVWQAEYRAPHVLALLLDARAAEHLECAFECASTPASTAQPHTQPQSQAQALAVCLKSGQTENWHGRRHRWTWRRAAA